MRGAPEGRAAQYTRLNFNFYLLAAEGDGYCRETYVFKRGDDSLPAVADARGIMRVRRKRDLAPAQFEIPFEHVAVGQKGAARPARRRIDFEYFSVCYDIFKYFVIKFLEVGIAQLGVGVGRVARNVAYVSDDIIVIGRRKALQNAAQIAGICPLLALA